MCKLEQARLEMNQHISTHVSSVSAYFIHLRIKGNGPALNGLQMYQMPWMTCQDMPAGRSWTSRSCCISAPLLGQIHPTMPRSSTVPLPVEIFCLSQATPVELAGGIHNGFRKKEHHGLLLEMWMEHVQITEQLWTDLNKTWTQLDFKAFDSWPWRDPWLVSRSARRLIFAFAVAFATSPSPRAWRRAFLRQSGATTPAMKSDGSACSRGLDLMSDYVHCLQMGHWLCTDYAPIILVTAICDCNGSKRRQIVTDSHCRAAGVYFWGCKDWKEPILNGPNFS